MHPVLRGLALRHLHEVDPGVPRQRGPFPGVALGELAFQRGRPEPADELRVIRIEYHSEEGEGHAPNVFAPGTSGQLGWRSWASRRSTVSSNRGADFGLSLISTLLRCCSPSRACLVQRLPVGVLAHLGARAPRRVRFPSASAWRGRRGTGDSQSLSDLTTRTTTTFGERRSPGWAVAGQACIASK